MSCVFILSIYNSYMLEDKIRCKWCLGDDLYIRYHDKEWGVPLHNDQKLFEFLTLEGAQAGLSWLTILKRRTGYRTAFADFDIHTVANFSEDDYTTLLLNPEIIRNKLKIRSTIINAQRIESIIAEFGSFDNYIWKFVDYKSINHTFSSMDSLPAKDEISVKMSKELSKRGLKFVGPTICYAFMQATGLINDHVSSCYRYQELSH
jgi:DNA-3-methyladenine glycosylase I